jgi:hypothetical protein
MERHIQVVNFFHNATRCSHNQLFEVLCQFGKPEKAARAVFFAIFLRLKPTSHQHCTIRKKLSKKGFSGFYRACRKIRRYQEKTAHLFI